MRISIVIPCHYSHFKYLPGILNIYEKQTMKPYEIVVVISEYDKLSEDEINSLKLKSKYKFQLNIIKINEVSYAGNTRRIGTENAIGDIIIFQDADDIPHKNRIRIIRNLFKKHKKIDFICHSYSRNKNILKSNQNYPKYFILKKNIFRNIKLRKSLMIAHGNYAIRSRIKNNLNWFPDLKRCQDLTACIDICDKYKGLYIYNKLYHYRQKNSAKKYIGHINFINYLEINGKNALISPKK